MKAEERAKLWWGIGGAVAVGILVAGLIWAPWYFEGDHVRDERLAPSAGIIITGFRTMVIAVVAGAIAALGLYYTHRNHKHAEKLYEHSQEQFAHAREKDRVQADLARQSHITELYVEAIKLLGSDNPTECLGGIYSLERIMRDSEKDRTTVVAVLAAFIRRQAPLPGNLPAERSDEVVQAALTVLGRRPAHAYQDRIDLRRTDLSGLSFESVDLRRARLGHADLGRADMRDADLSEIWAPDISFEGSYMRGVNLDRAWLPRADFTGASIVGISFRDATVDDAKGLNLPPESHAPE
jgi:hypothetical protein